MTEEKFELGSIEIGGDESFDPRNPIAVSLALKAKECYIPGRHIALLRDAPEQKSASGKLFIPDMAQRQTRRGIVVLTGDQTEKDIRELDGAVLQIYESREAEVKIGKTAVILEIIHEDDVLFCYPTKYKWPDSAEDAKELFASGTE